jgi:hypothetical protein
VALDTIEHMFDMQSVPGPGLAAALDPLVCGDLTDYEVVDAIVAWDRMVSWATARQAELVSELAHRRSLVALHEGQRTPRRDEVDEFAADELAVHLRLTRRAAESRLGLALALDRLPGTAAALRAGRIDPWRAMVIADSVGVLPDGAARAVEDRVLPRAGEQTSGQLRRSCARAVVRTDPQAADRRCQLAYRERAAVLTPLPDGMAELLVRLRADTAVAVWAVLDTAARQPSRAGAAGAAADDRSLDARRADALADLVLGRAGGPTATETTRETVPPLRLLTCTAPDDPVELAGYGPLPPVLARQLAAAGPRAVVTVSLDPTPPTGSADTYRPSPALDRYVRTRDRHCQFPTCRQPAHRGDLDHIIPFPLGPTTAQNMTALCRRHHRLKQHPGWALARGPDGTLRWSTPTGHVVPARSD